MRSRTVNHGTGKTAAGIRVPGEIVAAIGRDKRPPVHATINGYLSIDDARTPETRQRRIDKSVGQLREGKT